MARPLAPQRGFTATELMVVIGVVALLAALAAPNMAQMVRIQRLRTATFDVYASLNFARSEAVKRNKNVTITPNSGQWSDGWRVTDSSGNILKEQSGWTGITMVGPATVGFAGSGRALVTGFVNITSPDVESSKHRCVRIDASGRAVSQEGAC